MRRTTTAWAAGLFLAAGALARGQDVTIVRDGRPAAAIVCEEAGQEARRGWNDRAAAGVLQEWIEKMSGARLEIAERPAEGLAAIYVGRAAVRAGLKIDGIDSPSGEGLRVRTDGKDVYLAGQDGTSTAKAACRLLETVGCRYFMDIPGDLGKVIPRRKTVTVGPLNLREKPGFLLRKIWGSQWGGATLWKVWNGAGGVEMGTAHSWGRYVPRDLFAEHPEYWALRGGERRPGGWYCTSNPAVRKIFAEGVLRTIEGGQRNPSISPDDGVAYCECAECRAQDDPASIEPSSGQVNVTNRYCDFIDDVARKIVKSRPDSILGFYCYADYTQAPTSGIRLSPNICAWIAPIRYCRFHRTGHPGCPTRGQLSELIDGWNRAASRIAWRAYNFNLAECLVPFNMCSIWAHDLPMLKSKGCIGVNLESLDNWSIYGPHLYLSIRMAYNPDADSGEILDGYCMDFFGPLAGPLIREYWQAVDRGFQDLKCHSGSFYAIHRVYTPEFLGRCQSLLVKAVEAARDDDLYARRVAIVADGLANAGEYARIREAMNRGDFAGAREIYEKLLSRAQAADKAGWGNHYTVNYLKRFLGGSVLAGAAAVEGGKVLRVLPDRLRMAYDEKAEGEALGYSREDFDDSKWPEVATYSDTLDAQGLPDRRTVLWYRARVDLPPPGGRLILFCSEIDGDASVYVNGRLLEGTIEVSVGRGKDARKETRKVSVFPKRKPFEVDVTGAARAGANTIAVRCDHGRITELFLGGIIRPILLIERPAEK